MWAIWNGLDTVVVAVARKITKRMQMNVYAIEWIFFCDYESDAKLRHCSACTIIQYRNGQLMELHQDRRMC